MKTSGTRYFGVRPFLEFINVIDHCHAVITPVTMALHLAIGLSKPVVLLNNIFNRHEFHLYGHGTVVEPRLDCLGCYKKDFDRQCPVEDCTKLYDIQEILSFLETYPFRQR
jgi:ADP-heptose:LPS heptosyltransferase